MKWSGQDGHARLAVQVQIKEETHAYVECSACFVTEQSQPFISFTLGVLELEQERRLLRDAVGLYTR